ncbi:unnamed protein product [Victoria cruziana]
MDASLLSLPSSSPPLLFSPFTKNSFLKRNPNSLPVIPRTRRFKLRVARNSSSATSESPPDAKTKSSSEIFGPERQLSGVQKLVDAVPLTARYAGSAVVVVGALAAGYALGLRIKGSQAAGVGGAVALGAVGGAAAFVVNSAAPGAAAVSVHNKVASYDDPELLNKEEIEEVATRYGVSKQNEEFNAELCDLYNRFVSSVIPPGSESLQGDEVDKIVKFKNSLGIDDPDAANVHMEIGRRIYRQRLETGDREADVEQRRAFQKLVYISNLVFGEASTFLLPWKRVFKVTDAQVEVAIRDNAQRLYSVNLQSVGRDVNAEQLIDLRAAQLRYKLSDEIAAELLGECNRKLVEENISAALDMVKSRSRIKESAVVAELEKILSFNNLLTSLKNHPQFNLFPPGIGPVSLLGGEYDGDRKIDDLKLLYRAFLTEALSDGRIEENELTALNHLRNIFGLGKRETEAIMFDVTSKAYRRRLSQAVTRGDLEIASSKAAFLQNLCDELRFDPQKASEIHEDIYRQKLQHAVSDGALTDDDVASLLRLRVLLCIPQQTIDAAHADICGSLFEKVVRDVINAGVDGYDEDLKARVRKASQGLRLTRDASMDIVSKAVRKALMNFVKRSKAVGNGTEAAKELKKMVAFNTVVVTEMIADIKGESPSQSEPIDVEQKSIEEEEPEWESLQTLRKTRPDKELRAKLGKPGQTEITLKDDLSERERADLYRTYLLYCISGEVTVVPFGGQIITKKDDSEYFLLNQLGQVLGMSGKEVVDVHRNLAEQAFSEKARVILADGQLTKERIEQLNEVQKQVGLPSELAQKVIKGITTTKMAAAIETAVSRGRITIKQVRELKEANVDLDSMISLHLRENLFKKTVDEIFSSGTGEFDEEVVYVKIPADLGIDVDKSREVVHELAKNRLSNSLLQAVALLRQRNQAGVVSSLDDMLACDKAVPSEPLSWSVPEELADLFCLYLHNEAPEDKVSRLQYLLGISDTTAAALRERGLPPMGAEEEFVF